MTTDDGTNTPDNVPGRLDLQGGRFVETDEWVHGGMSYQEIWDLLKQARPRVEIRCAECGSMIGYVAWLRGTTLEQAELYGRIADGEGWPWKCPRHATPPFVPEHWASTVRDAWTNKSVVRIKL